MKFVEIIKGGPNFWGEQILQKVWIIWSSLLYFHFKSFMDANSSSLIRFHCILYDSGVLLSGFSNFYQLKRGGSNFWDEPILQNVWIIWSPFLYFNLKSFSDPSSSSFTRFQSILYDSGVLLSGFSNLYQLKRGDLISGRNQFCRMSELFGPTFFISILKVFQTQVLRDLLDFNPFCMIQEYFCQGFQISTN